MAIKLNAAGEKNARARIAAGDYDAKAKWDITPADTNAMLGENGDDWTEYAKWFLAVDDAAGDDTKAHYKYPFGKGGKVYRSGLIAIRSRAAQQKETDVFDAAGKLIEDIDAKEDKFFRHYGQAREIEAAYEKFFRVTRNGQSVVGVRSAFATTVEKAAGLGEGQLRCMISTSTPDRCNDVMNPKGVDAKAFLNNPTVLWMHDAKIPSIGVCVRGSLKVLPTGIEAVVQFDLKDPFAAEVYRKYVDGFLFAFSIGFIPLEWEDDKEGTRTYTKYELLEFSCVTTPMNAEALVTEIGEAPADATEKGVPALVEVHWPDGTITSNADDVLAARIDAAQRKAQEYAALDFADPDNVQKFLEGVADMTATLTSLTHSLTTTTTTMSENKTTTTENVVEKAGAEFNAENKKKLKEMHDEMANIHKSFGNLKSAYKAFLTSKGVEIKDDPDNDGDDDSKNPTDDPFDTDAGKALVADVAVLKTTVETIPQLIADGIAAAKKAEADAEAARVEAEKKAAEDAEAKRLADLAEFKKRHGLD